jgi:hypothetical protein
MTLHSEGWTAEIKSLVTVKFTTWDLDFCDQALEIVGNFEPATHKQELEIHSNVSLPDCYSEL